MKTPNKKPLLAMLATTLRTIPAAILAVTLTPHLLAAPQDLGIKAPPQEAPIAIIRTTVHPVSSEPFVGYVLFEHGRITAMGPGEQMFIATTRIIDGSGKHVYPGLIGAVSRIGLIEISAVRASLDSNEVGGVTPEVRAIAAVNPDSNLIPVARSNGILTLGVFPSGGPIAGRPGVIAVDGWTWEDMALETEAGLVVSWPNVRPVSAWWMDDSDEEQLKKIRKNLDRIEDSFDAARAYGVARRADSTTPIDIRWEAMLPCLRLPDSTDSREEQLPVYVGAQELDQILSAVTFARRHELKLIIVGGRDAHLCAQLLKQRDVGVIVLGTHKLPKRDDSPFDEPFALPAKLEAAGVRWCLASGEESHMERNLPYSAARAAAYGLDPDAALRSITLSAAELLCVADRVGSIETGKHATLILTDGDPLEITTQVLRAFVEGREINLDDKQKQLDRKYREKYRQLGILKR